MHIDWLPLDIITHIQSFLFEEEWYTSTTLNKRWRKASGDKGSTRWKEYNQMLEHKRQILIRRRLIENDQKIIKESLDINYWDNDATPLQHTMIVGSRGCGKSKTASDIVKNKLKMASASFHTGKTIEDFPNSLYVEKRFQETANTFLIWLPTFLASRGQGETKEHYFVIEDDCGIDNAFFNNHMIQNIVYNGRFDGLYFIFIVQSINTLPRDVKNQLWTKVMFHAGDRGELWINTPCIDTLEKFDNALSICHSIKGCLVVQYPIITHQQKTYWYKTYDVEN
jgi:hypothetical protein